MSRFVKNPGRWCAVVCAGLVLAGCAGHEVKPSVVRSSQTEEPHGIDLRESMELAARAIPPRLDAAADYRPWFLLKGSNNIPVRPEHSMWDVGDMTGRYMESLIMARHMGITSPEFSQAEWRLEKYLHKSLGSDGLVHDPQNGSVDNAFSQGSALYGLVAWFEDTSDSEVRSSIERLITGLLQRDEKRDGMVIDPTAALPQCSGSHLAGYEIFPIIRFYELTGYADALKLAEGMTRWAMADPILAENGEIKSTDSWAGHIHSWLDTLAGCVRTARQMPSPERERIIAKSKNVYDWVRRSNMTSFGWIATFPTHGSSETCAISSVIRLALELSAAGHMEYLEDVERFARNQVVEAQFRDLKGYNVDTNHATPLLIGCFDSQSLPNGHLGTRGGEDVGNVEGCCLNGGMRALALAWDAIQVSNERGVTVQLALTRSGPGADVIDYQPFEGRLDVIPRSEGEVRVRLPSWVDPKQVQVSVDGKSTVPKIEKNFAVVDLVKAGQRVTLLYPLRAIEEDITAGGQKYHVQWKGNVVVGMSPPGLREPTYQGRLQPHTSAAQVAQVKVPDSYRIYDAARLAESSMLARMDMQRGGQPFFRTYPFSNPPRAEHEKWDDGDMTGRYVEALLLSRHITGLPIDAREPVLRKYLASLYDAKDGLCYTQPTEWTPRRACLFSESSAMLGLVAWYRETGSPEARAMLDRQVDGVMRIAVDRGDYAYFPKYEYDGKHYVDDPPGKDAPIWYGARLILPMVEYWKITQREDVKKFLEKIIRHCTQVSHFIGPDGSVEQGEGWWGHLHSTMDMAAGIAEFGRVTNRPELVAWAKRIYNWIGPTNTTRYGFVADVAGGSVCESCAIASRFRLASVLYRAGVLDPFDEIDRFLRNQLLHNQFRDLSFLTPLKPETTRTERAVYDGVDRMIRGTFQCWGTANDLIGHDDIEGCGAGGGVQGLAIAMDLASEWRDSSRELRINLLLNQRIRAKAEAPFTKAAPIAGEFWSALPEEGRVVFKAHQNIDRVGIRVPASAERAQVVVKQNGNASTSQFDGAYVVVPEVKSGETIEITFPLKQYETVEHAAGKEYRAKWKGNSVVSLEPAGDKFPLYQDGAQILKAEAPTTAPRY